MTKRIICKNSCCFWHPQLHIISSFQKLKPSNIKIGQEVWWIYKDFYCRGIVQKKRKGYAQVSHRPWGRSNRVGLKIRWRDLCIIKKSDIKTIELEVCEEYEPLKLLD